MIPHKSSKLSALFLVIFFLAACATNLPTDLSTDISTDNFGSITKINDQIVHFSNGQKGQLPFSTTKNPTIIYLVRHAEKMETGESDPLLTPQGMERANRLKDILEKAKLQQIYSTDYQRTQMTAAPTAEQTKLEVQSYDPRALADFANQLKQEAKGQKILVVGHSNTTPTLANALLGEEQFSPFDESEYGHFLAVVINENGETKGLDFNY